MTLAEVYEWVQNRYEYYRDESTGWKNSIRHNLSINRTFEKLARPAGEPGKGCYWMLNEAAAFDGLGISRRKRRRADRSKRGSGKKSGGDRAAGKSPSRSGSGGGRISTSSPSMNELNKMMMRQMSEPSTSSASTSSVQGDPAALLAAGKACSFVDHDDEVFSSVGYSSMPIARPAAPPCRSMLPVHVKAERRYSDSEVPHACDVGTEECYSGEMLQIECADDYLDEIPPNFELGVDNGFDMVVPRDWIV